MPIEINGRLHLRHQSDADLSNDVIIDIKDIQNQVALLDAAGFDRIVISDHPHGPDVLTLAGYVSGLSQRLGVLLEHRCGVVVPTMAARKFATVDRLLGGKLALHILDAAGDAERKSDGAEASNLEPASHRAEFIEILRAIWSSDQPIDFAGKYYRFQGGVSDVKPIQGGDIPMICGGNGAADLDVARRFADAVSLSFSDVAGVSEAVAAVHLDGAPPLPCMMAVPLRWDDEAARDGAQNAASVVAGSSKQIVDKLMEYYAAGVSNFTLSGDAARIGRDILPALRARALQYDVERGIA